MAKKRRKKQDPISELLGLSIIAVFFIAFYLSNSFSTSIVFAALWFAVCLSVVWYYANVKRVRLKRSGIFEIDKMDGRQFENYLVSYSNHRDIK